jgi:hypothetical protein
VVTAPAPVVASPSPAQAPDPGETPAGREIARLRSEVRGQELEHLNAGLFFLVRRYREEELDTMFQGQTAPAVIARAESEQKAERLALSHLALEMHFGSVAKARVATRGLSDAQIIKMAESLK